MDLNDQIKRHDCESYLDELTMHEAIVSTHTGQSSPVINLLNHFNYPIDGIWCSLGMKATKVGHSKFREGVLSKHRVIWMEFRIIDDFEFSDKIYKKVLQLKASDPRNVAKYISKTNKQLQKEQCMKKMEKLQSIPSDKLTITHQK